MKQANKSVIEEVIKGMRFPPEVIRGMSIGAGNV